MALHRCRGCGRYTLMENCPQCDSRAERVGPARYSPEDHYGAYRRALKQQVKEGPKSEEV